MFWYILAHAGEAGGGGSGFPPIHPILVNFTAALIPTSVAADLLGRILKSASLRATGFWTMCLAAVITPLTAFVGWLWMRSMGDMDHWQMGYHLWIGVSIAVLLIPLAIWRGRTQRKDRPIGAVYFVAALVLTGALVVQGELGGSMSFGNTLLFSGHESAAAHDHPSSHGDTGHPDPATHTSSVPGGWKDHIDVGQMPPTQP
jgi:uncharacterized membrane protein